MSEEKILTKEIAEQFLENEYSVKLSEFTSIEDAAAESLSKCKGSVSLDGLTQLSDAAAESLSKCKGSVSLDGLTELSDSAAESMSKCKGGLSLDGLTKLSDAAAESLSRCTHLSLNGLTELSDAAAEILSKRKEGLSLSALTELSDAAAEILSKCKGSVSLDGLTQLSDAAAESLSKCKGSVSLDGLTEVSDAAAESLSKCKGGLSLDGLTKLSDAAAESLSKFNGDRLSLSALKELSDAAAESLSKFKGDYLDLNCLTELSDAAAESLSKFKGCRLSLSALKELSDAAAESLSKFEGDEINLNGLAELNVAAAQRLAKFEGWLRLDGLTSFCEVSAECFSTFKGILSLGGLSSLSKGALGNLCKMNGGLDLNGLNELSEAEAEILCKHEGPRPLAILGETFMTEKVKAKLSKRAGTVFSENVEALSKISNLEASLLVHRLYDYDAYENMFEMNNLKSLDAKTAKILGERDWDELWLGGLTELSEEVAEGFAYHGYAFLILDGLTEISDDVAKHLGKLKNGVNLHGLTAISDAAAESLSGAGWHLGLSGIRYASMTAIETLARRNLHEGGGYIEFHDPYITETYWKARRALSLPPQLASMYPPQALLQVTLDEKALNLLADAMKSDGIRKAVGHWNGSGDDGYTDGFLEKEDGAVINFWDWSKVELLDHYIMKILPGGSECNHGSVGTLTIDLDAGTHEWTFNWNAPDMGASRKILRNIRAQGIDRLTAQYRFELKDDCFIPRDLNCLTELSDAAAAFELWELICGDQDGEWKDTDDGQQEVICDYKSLKCEILEDRTLPASGVIDGRDIETILIDYLGGLADKCRSFESPYYPFTVFDRFFTAFYGTEVDLKQLSASAIEKLQCLLVDFPLTLTVDTKEDTLTFRHEDKEFVHKVPSLNPDARKTILLNEKKE